MMTTKRLLLAGIFPLSLLGCASDPNKEANDAHTANLKSERVQQQEKADDRSDQKVAAAEALRENTDKKAEHSGTSGAAQDSVQADAKLTEAKSVYRAKATERLEKADARTSELKQIIDRAGAKATTASRDSLRTVDTQRSMVTKELDQLPRIANDNWQQAKTSLDTQLDILEGLVKKTADEVKKIKH